MNLIDDLKVKFRFEERHFDKADENYLEVEILGQRFYQVHRFILSVPEKGILPTGWSRVKAAEFGRMLICVGKEIELQAEYGEPQEFEQGGIKIKRF